MFLFVVGVEIIIFLVFVLMCNLVFLVDVNNFVDFNIMLILSVFYGNLDGFF